MKRICTATFIITLTMSTGAVVGVLAQLPMNAEHEAIAYSTTTPTDPVAALDARIQSGSATLAFDEQRGYLPAVLAALDIPVSSQGLVFSKTSLQLDRIAPWAPRAIYFNDNVYVGWVQGGAILELASVDPKLGTIFYSLAQEAGTKPRFTREGTTCLVCHDSNSITGGVPGLIMRSVLPDRYGYSITTFSDGPTTDQTPIAARWGGWYVTGSVGDQTHVGNIFAPQLAHEIGNGRRYIEKDLQPAGNVADLDGRFDLDPYLTRHSDAVALMVLAHQTRIHNLITVANYETRRALADEGAPATADPDAAHAEATLRRVRNATEPLVRAMFLTKEAPLTGRITGTSGFAEHFPAAGPRDPSGRSLRDLDLERRLFRYPLSFLVYSEAFDALPPLAKKQVYSRFRQVLRGSDPNMQHLTTDDRVAIMEILEATKPDFAAVKTN
jgi:hypothetical protein